jgi:serine/threonine protein kinase
MSEAGRNADEHGTEPDMVDSREETLWDSGLRQAFTDDAPVEDPLEGWSAGPLTRHELGEELGRGGIGLVRAARDLRLERDIAIKTLHEKHLGNPQLVARFVREAQIAAQLQHPGIVPIYDFGVDPEGRPWLAMRRVEGRSLAEHFTENRPSESGRMRWLGVLLRACQAIGYAHRQGIVHRDLKPANIMVGAFGEVLVMDWGFAKRLGEVEPQALAGASSSASDPASPEGSPEIEAPPEDSPLGATSIPGTTLGTPGYLSPEQARGELERIGPPSDVFALGSMLYEILVGHPVFQGRTALSDAREAKLQRVAAELRAQDVEPSLATLTLRCLGATPEERPADANVLARELSAWLDQSQSRAHDAELSAARAESRLVAERRSKRLTLALGLTLMIGALAVTSYLWSRQIAAERLDSQIRITLQEIDKLRARGAMEEALTRVAHAQGLIAGKELAPELRRQLDQAHDSLRSSVQIAQLLRELERVRISPNRGPRAGHEFAAAFERFRLPARREPDTMRQKLSELPEAVRLQIAAALDDWALAVPHDGPEARDRDLLLELANAADPDTLRQRIRAALLTHQSEELLSLATEASSQSSTQAQSYLLLSGALEREGLRRPSIQLLEKAAATEHSDFWIHLRLAREYHRGPRRDLAKAQMHAAIAEELRGEANWRALPGRPGQRR